MRFGIYPAPDGWRVARRQVGADTDSQLADLLDMNARHVGRARLHIGDTKVGHDFVAQAVYAFRDLYTSPFDFLFRVRRIR